ncbi:MAG: TIGR03936 family radical SAM-associated protein [Gemmataceae bacterium]
MATEAFRPAPVSGACDKIRLVFRKGGSLRWLSHHDLLRTFERLLRRANLPVHHSGGFHPHARLIFALSLPLGVVGLAEIVDIEMDEILDPGEVLQRIRAHCPPGLEILEARRVAVHAGLRVTGLCYGLNVPVDHLPSLQHRLAEVLAASQWIIERTRPPRRRFDIRPFLRDLRLDPISGRLEIDLHLLEAGTARPDEVLTLLGLSDLVDAGVPLERVRLDLYEPLNPDTLTPPAPPESLDSDEDLEPSAGEDSFKEAP